MLVLQVVPGHQRHRLLLIALGVLGGDGVLAVQGHTLVSLLRQQLHEAHLVLVRLVIDHVLRRFAFTQPDLKSKK